jgi:hypothetical protein
MKVEVRGPLDVGAAVLVDSSEFGRMGHATVKYCQRDQMRYLIGLRFGAAFGLSDPARQEILKRVLADRDSQ